MEYKGIDYLRNRLAFKRRRVLIRYGYYDMKNIVSDFGISTPPELRHWMGTLGWCAKAVDSLADRLLFREFDDDIYGMNQIFEQNQKDIFVDAAILGALISSCDFVYITADEDGFPRFKVIDGAHATGEIDPVTNMLKEGYAVLEWNEYDNPILEAYLLPGITQIFERFIGLVSEYHTSERGMAFYADKMCLTPKYLSKLIKQASGRSAPDWIDSFVILEAKNMLNFSDMAIKEIVYKLHFPNQSVFYKFFKAHTGMTPTEYRNG